MTEPVAVVQETVIGAIAPEEMERLGWVPKAERDRLVATLEQIDTCLIAWETVLRRVRPWYGAGALRPALVAVRKTIAAALAREDAD